MSSSASTCLANAIVRSVVEEGRAQRVELYIRDRSGGSERGLRPVCELSREKREKVYDVI